MLVAARATKEALTDTAQARFAVQVGGRTIERMVTREQFDAVNDFFWRARGRNSRLVYLEASAGEREAA